MNSHKTLLASLLAALLLAACGGGSDDEETPVDPGAGGGGGATTLTCNTAGYVADAVAVPTEAELAAYAGTFNGEEGAYAMDGTFTKSGDATLVLTTAGAVTYKGTSYTATSFCLDKVASPTYGRILYVEVGLGKFDMASAPVSDDLGQAWGVSPVDGTTIFRKGLKP